MTDEQRSGMDPDEMSRGRPFTEDQRRDETTDTEGHSVRWKAKDDEQAGSETGTEAAGDDTGGHARSATKLTEDAPIEPDGGYRLSDRNLKRRITPVRW